MQDMDISVQKVLTIPKKYTNGYFSKSFVYGAIAHKFIQNRH